MWCNGMGGVIDVMVRMLCVLCLLCVLDGFTDAGRGLLVYYYHMTFLILINID